MRRTTRWSMGMAVALLGIAPHAAAACRRASADSARSPAVSAQ